MIIVISSLLEIVGDFSEIHMEMEKNIFEGPFSNFFEDSWQE